jgi:cell division protein FtsW
MKTGKYFGDRVQAWLHPFDGKITGVSWQTRQSLIAIGSGGWFGLGLGNSRQKYLYLPESKNDFVFAIVCEELGFFGSLIVILIFLLFIIRGFYIASHAPDKLGMLLAVGLTAQIGVQALLNIAVVTSTIPNTGISLPFFSYGGTALIMQLAEMGIILNISRQSIIET